MPARYLLFVTAAWLLVPDAGVRASSVTLLDEIVVRVYDAAGVDLETKRAALAVAARTLRPAADVVFRECGHPSEADCTRPAAGALVLRIVDGARGQRADRRAALRRPGDLPLGDAFVEKRTGAGVLATVYSDRVTRLAREGGVGLSTLLGRTMAHEVGHLLLGTTAHTAGGLMRAVWTVAEVREDRPEDWVFPISPRLPPRARR
jgi:hypothetical protein